MPSISENPREAHRHYYGLVRPVDDPIWQSIFPPNGYGCLCWVKQLTKSQAEKIGISAPLELEMEEAVNTRTGEVLRNPKGITPSFAHHHDRMSAMRHLYDEKLKLWEHVPDALKAGKKAEFEAELNRYMLDLVLQEDFNSLVPTVVGHDFARRFEALATAVKAAEGSRKNSMALRKTLAAQQAWVVATISPEIQAQLQANTALVLLSEDTLVKMMAHHGEYSEVELFREISQMLKNPLKISVENDLHAIYFIIKDYGYKVCVKATKNREELYLTTIVKMAKEDLVKV